MKRSRPSLLDATRDQLDEARPVSPRGAPYWLRDDDPLQRQVKGSQKLLERGDLVWGYVHGANGALFGPIGEWVLPAIVLHGEEGVFDEAPHRLEWVSGRLGEILAGKPPREPGLRRIHDAFSGEDFREVRLAVPRRLADGLTVFLSAVLVARADLPLGHLACPYVPLLVHPKVPAVMLLPTANRAPDLQRALVRLSAS